MKVGSLLAIAFLGTERCDAFTPTSPTLSHRQQASLHSPASRSRLRLLPVEFAEPSVAAAIADAPLALAGLFRQVTPGQARGEFWFQFVAGSGGLGIGIAQMPKIAKEIGSVRSLAGEGPTLGGDAVSIGPLAGLFYPPPAVKDVEKVIAKTPSAVSISKQSKSPSYFAAQGYIVGDDFTTVLSKAGCNPLAIKTAFDALTEGKGSAVEPDIFDEKIRKWKGDGGTAAYAADLQGAAVTKIISYGTLIFLIGLVGDLIIESGINGFVE